MQISGYRKRISTEQGLGLLSLAAAIFAAYKFIDTFGWIVHQWLHPVHLFDYPSGDGESNILWILPCTIAIFCGILSRKTIWGKLGISLSVLVLLGIMLMVHWDVQIIQDNWRIWDEYIDL